MPTLSVPITSALCSMVVVPVVPPKYAAPAVASIADGEVVPIPRNPAEVKVDVAVPPNDAALAVSTLLKRFVVVAFVAVRPPLKLSSVVVALAGKRYPKIEAR